MAAGKCRRLEIPGAAANGAQVPQTNGIRVSTVTSGPKPHPTQSRKTYAPASFRVATLRSKQATQDPQSAQIAQPARMEALHVSTVAYVTDLTAATHSPAPAQSLDLTIEPFVW